MHFLIYTRAKAASSLSLLLLRYTVNVFSSAKSCNDVGKDSELKLVEYMLD